MNPWYIAAGAEDIPTPALLVFPDRIEENIRRMVLQAGTPDNLRPHVKTHKMSEVVRLKLQAGISKFKCSTIAEAEMVALSGGKDILLAMQPVGPQITRFFQLQKKYPGTRFSTIVDTQSILEQVASLASAGNQETDLWLDINNGMNRTGVPPGDNALQLIRQMNNMSMIRFRGLHVYDGHIHEQNPDERRHACEKDFEPVEHLILTLQKSGINVPVTVAGGTPTSPFHARRLNTELSPGTCVLWDYGYQEQFSDLDYLPAALVLTRVISKPERNLLCLDLGHKAIAAEMPHPRVKLQDIPVERFVNHSEEHLVIESPHAERWHTGDILYGIPWHICPTVPRYKSAYAVKNGRISGEWHIDARDRIISV